MIDEHTIYSIGTLTRTHGVRGEVAFQFTDDVWDRVEADYLLLRLDGLPVPFFLEEWRFRSDTVALLKFQDVDSADQAAALVGAEVLFPAGLTPEEPAPGELTWRHFTGFEVWQEGPDAQPGTQPPGPGAACLGTVTAVLDQTANVLLEATTPEGRSLLIPAHETFVLGADHRRRQLRVHLPDDLLSLNL